MLPLRRTLLAAALLFGALPFAVAPFTPVALAQTKSSADSSALLDINTATSDQLKALPGIGDAYAKRIIDGRPYTAKNQIVTRGIVPQKTYDGIKDKIIAAHPAKK